MSEPKKTIKVGGIPVDSEISKQNLTTGFTPELQTRLIEYDRGGIETEIEGRVADTIEENTDANQ